MMKSIQAMAMAIVCCIAFISCGGSSDLSDEIIGTWDFTSLERSDCDDPSENFPLIEVGSDGCAVLYGEQICNQFLVFNEDLTASETFTDSGGRIDRNFTYTVNNSNNTVSFCLLDNNGCETLTVEGNELSRIFTQDGCRIVAVYTKS